MVKFSIIVPAYNTAGYITSCLDSVCAATLACEANIEVIVVDDGSTDGTAEALDAYVRRQLPPRLSIKVLHQKNSGVSCARNLGLATAQGEWILFVDSDDMLRKSAIADIASVVESCPDVDFVVFGDVKFKDGDSPNWCDYAETMAFDADLSKNIPECLASVCVGGAAYRRKLIEGLVFEKYVLGEDLVFFCAVLARARKCRFLGKAEYANRLRRGSASRSMETSRKLHDRIAYHESMFKVIAASGKRFGRAFVHGRGNSWIESIPSLICEWPANEVRMGLFAQWRESMRLASSMPFFSCWQRFVAWMVSRIQLEVLVKLLCVLPYGLKCKGVHR